MCACFHERSLHFNSFDSRLIVPGVSARIRIHLDGTLEIREVRATDVGQYKCIIRSEGGHDERVAQLKIIELPYPPSNVVAGKLPKLAPVKSKFMNSSDSVTVTGVFGFNLQGANSKAVNLTWSSGFDGNSPILKFIIQKRTVTPDSGNSIGPQTDFVPAAWETLLANISAEVRYVIIEGLKPSASYQFRISSINAVGEGEPSSPSNVITLPQEGKFKVVPFLTHLVLELTGTF